MQLKNLLALVPCVVNLKPPPFSMYQFWYLMRLFFEQKSNTKDFEALVLFILVRLVFVAIFQQYLREQVNMQLSSYNGLERVEIEIN